MIIPLVLAPEEGFLPKLWLSRGPVLDGNPFLDAIKAVLIALLSTIYSLLSIFLCLYFSRCLLFSPHLCSLASREALAFAHFCIL
jgi:hypothetical protein